MLGKEGYQAVHYQIEEAAGSTKPRQFAISKPQVIMLHFGGCCDVGCFDQPAIDQDITNGLGGNPPFIRLKKPSVLYGRASSLPISEEP